MKHKTLFVFGAGFSYPFIPTQANLLSEIINYNPGVLATGFEIYNMAKIEIINFLHEFFSTLPNRNIEQELLTDITLEDIYTILDKAVSRYEHLNGHDWEKLLKIRDCLNICLVYYVNAKQNEHTENIQIYADIVRKLNDKLGNNWSCIGLNWDTLWDQALHQCNPSSFIDYGFSAYHILENGEILQPVKDKLGTRYLKLHGSFNWLTCPRCHSLFVSSWTNIGWRGYFDRITCRRCINENSRSPILQPLFLTPTIQKDISNPYLNTCWNEALFDLETASEIIFIGYSFPLADHEFRYILRKGVSKTTKIRVVLSPNDYSDHYQLKNLLPPARYKSFFGIDENSFYFNGYIDFFDSYFKE